MAQPHPDLVRRVKDALGEIDQTAKYLAENEAEAFHLGFELELEERAIIGSADDLSVAALGAETWGARRRVLGFGVNALQRIEVEGDDLPLEDDEVLGLKVILAITARPAILIVGSRVIEPPRRWGHLLDVPDSIARVSSAVGWIKGSGDPVGTGFMVAEDRIMTNAHVAKSLDGQDRITIAFSDHFKDQAALFVIRDFRTHPTLDLAIGRVEPTGGRALPRPLALASEPPAPIDGREVYAIGYPRTPTGSFMSPQIRDRLFARTYDVKRLQPGQLRRLSDLELGHDCSTLGGNSGSPIVDLDEGDLVIGLHYTGSELTENVAVPLWKLAADPLLEGLNWD